MRQEGDEVVQEMSVSEGYAAGRENQYSLLVVGLVVGGRGFGVRVGRHFAEEGGHCYQRYGYLMVREW